MNAKAQPVKERVATLGVFAALLISWSCLFGGTATAAEINCSHAYELCLGTGSADDIFGWSNQNEIVARAGRDHAWGYAAIDWIFGGEDGDSINGGEGGDVVKGETGNDSYFELGGNYGVYGQSQNDAVEGNVGRDFLEGNQGADGLYGGDSADVMFAEDGEADTVNGGAGESGHTQPCYVDGYDAWTACEPF